MSDGRQRVRRVFMQIAEVAEPDRDAALTRECGMDAELRAEVEALLRADRLAGGFMSNPTGAGVAVHPDDAATLAAAPGEQPGRMIGRYKLLQPIGEGGFGSVWMAEQREPVKRRVAVKIIKLGMDTRQVIARFEAERQALAMMEHPNIAKVLDAGATESGRPYFVMEYIKGVPILEYCDTDKLDTRARLELFGSVCHAIQHAHQKGILHRDIKPSNVLVTMHDGVPVSKVIDFGIAKATGSELTQKTLFTEHRQMIGTPAYMSPEQAEMSGLDVDTRSDIYSLGVLLYELLTGTTPFGAEELLSKGLAEMLRLIREVEPHKPSTRLSSLGDTATRAAQQRHAPDVRKLSLMLRGDLDWIVMKCLEKDRTRRYETANALAADIKRHLNDEPVTAGAPSAAYLLRKFVKRNRVWVIAGSAVTLALLLGVAGTTTGMIKALHERSRAGAEAAKAVRLTEYMQGMLEAAGPMRAGSPEVTVQFVLDEAARGLDAGALRDQPEAEAAMRTTIGKTYVSLGRYDDAEVHLRRALDLNLALFGDQSAEYAASLHTLGVFLSQDKYELPEPEQLLTAALAIRRRLYGGNDHRVADTLEALALVMYCEGRPDLSDPLNREAARIRKTAPPSTRDRGPGSDEAQDMIEKAVSLQAAGDDAGAESMRRAAIARLEKSFPHEHPRVADAVRGLGSLLCDQGNYAAAVPHYRDVLAIKRAIHEEVHVLVMEAWADLIRVLFAAGDTTAALRELPDALEMGRRMIPGKNPAAFSLAQLLSALPRESEAPRLAEPLYREALEFDRAHYGGDHPLLALSVYNHASVLEKMGELAGAEALFREAYVLRRGILGETAIDTMRTRLSLGQVLHRMGRTAEAEPHLRAVYELAGQIRAPDSVATTSFADVYAEFLSITLRFDDAQRIIDGLPDFTPEEINRGPSAVAHRMSVRGRILAVTGHHQHAELLLRDSLRVHRRIFPETHPSAWRTFETMSDLGGVLLQQGKYAEAEPLLLEAHRGMTARSAVMPAHAEPRIAETLEYLVRLYEATGNQAQTAAWRSQLKAARATTPATPTPGADIDR